MSGRFWAFVAEGNRYLVVDDARSVAPMLARLADARDPVAADGVVLAAPAGLRLIDMHVFNPDGSVAGMCGNGARCVIALALRRGWATVEDEVLIRAPGGTVAHRVEDVAAMRVEALIRLDRSPIRARRGDRVELDLGVRHLVVFRDLERVRLAHDGPALERSVAGGTSVMLTAMRAPGALDVLPWERAVGAVRGCATGAAAAAIAAHVTQAEWPARTTVHQPEGTIQVVWRPHELELRMTGTAQLVAEGAV